MRLALADCEVVADRFVSQFDLVRACGRRATDVLFFEPDLCGFDPVAALQALGASGFHGAVQLVSGSHDRLNQIKQAGEQCGLIMLRPLRKPFRASEIQRIADDWRRWH